MRRGRCGLAVAMTVAAIVTAGCATAAPPPPAEVVPPVGDARDARSADPCALPTGAQLAALGIAGTGAPAAAPEGPRCEWHGRPDLGITLYTGGGGIETLARNSEPTTSRVRLAGYPALETFTGVGEFCQYDVGVSATQVLSASLEGGSPDSCTALQSVLPGVVANLPALPG